MIHDSANLEEQYFLNRQDRYWLLNDAEKLCNYLEDVVSGLLSSSDRTTQLDTYNLPFGYDQINWKKRSLGIKSQDRMASYLTNKLIQKKDESGDLGVIETRSYNISAISKDKKAEKTLQIVGRERAKEK